MVGDKTINTALIDEAFGEAIVYFEDKGEKKLAEKLRKAWVEELKVRRKAGLMG